MTRRRALLMGAAAALPAPADERTDILDMIAPLASALSSGDARAFISRIPPASPDYTRMRDNVRALVEQAEVTSSVDVLKYEGGIADLDWYMEIRSRATDTVVERRRGMVKLGYQDGSIRSLTPAEFFGPPKLSQ